MSEEIKEEKKAKLYNVRMWPMVTKDGDSRGPHHIKGAEMAPKMANSAEIAKMFPEFAEQLDAMDKKESLGPFRYSIDGVQYTMTIKRNK